MALRLIQVAQNLPTSTTEILYTGEYLPGDFVVLIGSTNTTTAFSNPLGTGWTQRATTGTNGRLRVWTRNIGATETRVTLNTVSAGRAYSMFVFRDAVWGQANVLTSGQTSYPYPTQTMEHAVIAVANNATHLGTGGWTRATTRYEFNTAYRIAPANTSANFINFAPNANATTNPFVTLLIRESINQRPAYFTDVSVTPEAITTGNVTLRYRVRDPNFDTVRHRVAVNGVQFTNWTAYTTSPTAILQYSIPNTRFALPFNTILIEAQDSGNGSISSTTVTVERLNARPFLSFNPRPDVGKEDLLLTGYLTDTENDLVEYSIAVNGLLYKDFTGPYTTPHTFSEVIPNELLNIGNNTIIVIVRDEGGSASYSTTARKVNLNPSISELGIKGDVVTCVIDDGDLDKVRFNLSVNGVQVFPEVGFTPFLPVPYNMWVRVPLEYRSPAGEDSVILLTVEDEVGGVSTENIVVDIGHVGLIFHDEDETVLSTEIGVVIEHLRLSNTLSEEWTEESIVYLSNKMGYPVNNVTIYVGTSDQGVNVELSYDNEEFHSEEELTFLSMPHDSTVSFKIRAIYEGVGVGDMYFEIKTKADTL